MLLDIKDRILECPRIIERQIFRFKAKSIRAISRSHSEIEILAPSEVMGTARELVAVAYDVLETNFLSTEATPVNPRTPELFERRDAFLEAVRKDLGVRPQQQHGAEIGT